MMISSLRINKIKNLRYPCLILSLQLALLGILGLNELGIQIPIVRQFVSFVYLTFVPGVLILKILKLEQLAIPERFVLSVGLSISFIMFFGLLVNSILPIFGYLHPLSITAVSISFSAAIFVLLIIDILVNEDTSDSTLDLKFSNIEKCFLIAPIFFLVMSICGSFLMNINNNNIILIFLLFLIPAYIIFISIFRTSIPDRIYPIVIILISVSFTLMFALRGSHIILGLDPGYELFFFRSTLDNMHWSILNINALDSCLSISLLPTIYQSFLNINNEEYLFKILFPLLSAISPLVVYLISRKYLLGSYAFLAAVFFMSQETFLRTNSARLILAIFFSALAIFVLFQNDINEVKKRFLFIIFLASIVVSHYSTSYIFFFLILFTFLWKQILTKFIDYTGRVIDCGKNSSLGINAYAPIRSGAKENIRPILLLLFFVMIFVWYSQVAASPFQSGLLFIGQTFQALNNIFLAESRVYEVELLIGKNIPYRISSIIGFVFTWATFIFIGLGILTMIFGQRYTAYLSRTGKPAFGSGLYRLNQEYVLMSVGCGILLAGAIILPFVSNGYSIKRLYQVMVIVLSTCFILGGISMTLLLQSAFTRMTKRIKIFKSILTKINLAAIIRPPHIKVSPLFIIIIIIVPYNIYTTGVLAQICGEFPGTNTLNSPKNTEGNATLISTMTWHICDQDCFSAEWFARCMNKESMIFVPHFHSAEVLMGEGKVPASNIDFSLVPNYEKNHNIVGYIYLRYIETTSGVIMAYYPPSSSGLAQRVVPHRISDYFLLFSSKNRIYSNGGSEIFK